MKPSFLAVITPVASGAHPDHELPKPPSGGRPDHTLPGDLPKPEHPIYWPLPPGAPVDPEYGVPIEHPDQGLPQPPAGAPPRPTHPIAGGEQPSHPIVLPPDSGGWLPVFIWGGGNVPMPTPPIALPPEGETDDGRKVKYVAGWTAETGWVSFGVVQPSRDHVTPSRRK